jgi:hypothetical protein
VRTENGSERRRAQRRAATGTIEVLFADPVPTVIEGEVLDVSSTGFRLSHTSNQLVAGLDVQLRYEGHQYLARIIWTHIQNGHRQSGCMLLRGELGKPAAV